MNGFASASFARGARKASLMACMGLLACAIPLHAATWTKSHASTPTIPAPLRHAINQTLGTDQWIQTQQVTETSTGFTPEFGVSVALHGTTAMVGAQQEKVGDNEDQGAVYVFEQSGGVWTMTQELTASDGLAGDTFGNAVVFEGNTALIGAYAAMIGDNFSQGAAYVFTLQDGTWTQTQKLVAPDGQMFENFGYSLGLNGTTAMIGADAAQVGDNSFQGAVYVFDGTGGTWTNTQKLAADDGGIGDIFGFSIAFDGTTAAISAYSQNQSTGAVYVFGQSGGTWTQTQKLLPDDAATNTYFGYALAVSGSTLLIGSWGANPGGVDTAGAAYIFTNSGGVWTQAQELVADDGLAQDKFGHAVALQGTTALIGADGSAGPEGPDAGTANGAVYAFDGSSGTWTKTQKFFANDSQRGSQFGFPVTLDGNTALVGSWLWSTPQLVMQGSAYFFEFGSTPPPTYLIGGTVSGLAGSGLVLQQNGGDDLSIAADGTFAFATALVEGSPYSVTVSVQPGDPAQTCSVTNGTGTVSGADVTDIEVTCTTTPTYTIGGTVSGLAGSGLVLQQDGGDDLAIAANGNFTFATALFDGRPYAVSVSAQPANPAQTCTVANATGTIDGANVDDVAVTCTTDITDRLFADGFDPATGGGGSATLAETTDMTPVAQNSAACGNSDGLTTADNQYWRRYYLNEYAVTSAADIESVDVAIEQTTGAPNMTVTLYTTPHSVAAETIDIGQLTQIGQAVVASPADAILTSVNVPVSGTIADPVGNDLVVEVSTEDGSIDSTAFYIGSTPSPETHLSFLSSAGCGVTDPIPPSDIGYPDMHIIEAVNLTY